ncbi:MAG: type III pantothenate kinase [Pseudomonadota bacterium]
MTRTHDSADTLLIDAGNSRLKWAIWRDGVLVEHGSSDYNDDEDRGVAAALEGVGSVRRVALGSVASSAVAKGVRAWAASRAPTLDVRDVAVEPLPVLEPAYSDYGSLGVDRWLALLGARSLYPGHVCVADCGTALTLDALAADGRHLGGVIVPGYTLMQEALLTQTARIRDADQPLPDTVFGTSTGAAVNAGATFSLAAVLDRFVAETRERLEGEVVVFATGGARERLLRFATCDVIDEPDLVLLGLAARLQIDRD